MAQQALVSSAVSHPCIYLFTDCSVGVQGVLNPLEMMEGGLWRMKWQFGGVDTMGNGPGESYPPSPSSDVFDILACPMGMIPLISGLCTIYIMYIWSQMQSWCQVSHNHLPWWPWPHPSFHSHPFRFRPSPYISIISLHCYTPYTYYTTPWMSPESVPPHGIPPPPPISLFCYLGSLYCFCIHYPHVNTYFSHRNKHYWPLFNA